MPQVKKSAKSHNFSAAFERMCNFVAISSTQTSEETLQELILQCLVLNEDKSFHSVMDFSIALNELFGLDVPGYQLQEAIDILKEKGNIVSPALTNWVLESSLRDELKRKNSEAILLEEQVKAQWLHQIAGEYPTLFPELAWSALQEYLTRTFKRHGIQATALLDPAIDNSDSHLDSLSQLLHETISVVFKKERQQGTFAQYAITAFLAEVGHYPQRTAYIAQLADGTFNYFSLTVDPEVAEGFRKNLNPLVLFLDTNFLFGILDLHDNVFSDVSQEILASVKKYEFPFKLRYHPITYRELIGTIQHYGQKLKKRVSWPQGFSRAVAQSRNLSGIELKFHQKNAEQKVDPHTFFERYGHPDIEMKEKGIDIYRNNTDRGSEISVLLGKYNSFLEERGKDKARSSKEHDITVLDTVIALRSTAPSSLDAGALLLTCDYLLYKFDWELSRRENRRACAVLPNLFMQLMRRFIPSTPDFDRSFAETFAIPEFRVVGSGIAEASSRLLSLLASYNNLSEGTAVRMLSNDLLLNNLNTINNDNDYQAIVESALADENVTLMEEKVALQNKLEADALEKANLRAQLDETRIFQEKNQQETVEVLLEKDKALLAEQDNYKFAQQEALDERNAREEAERNAKEESLKRARAEQIIELYHDIAAISFGIVLASAMVIFVNQINWKWLLEHQESYALQGLGSLLIITVTVGASRSKWRSHALGTSGVFALLVVFLSLLGGKN